MIHLLPSHDNIQDAAGFFNRVGENEPVFVLQASDHFAAELVRAYADRIQPYDPAYAAAVRGWAEVMYAWPDRRLRVPEVTDVDAARARLPAQEDLIPPTPTATPAPTPTPAP